MIPYYFWTMLFRHREGFEWHRAEKGVWWYCHVSRPTATQSHYHHAVFAISELDLVTLRVEVRHVLLAEAILRGLHYDGLDVVSIHTYAR